MSKKPTFHFSKPFAPKNLNITFKGKKSESVSDFSFEVSSERGGGIKSASNEFEISYSSTHHHFVDFNFLKQKRGFFGKVCDANKSTQNLKKSPFSKYIQENNMRQKPLEKYLPKKHVENKSFSDHKNTTGGLELEDDEIFMNMAQNVVGNRQDKDKTSEVPLENEILLTVKKNDVNMQATSILDKDSDSLVEKKPNSKKLCDLTRNDSKIKPFQGSVNLKEDSEALFSNKNKYNGECSVIYDLRKHSSSSQTSHQNIQNDIFMNNAENTKVEKICITRENASQRLEDHKVLPLKGHLEDIQSFDKNLCNVDAIVLNECNDISNRYSQQTFRSRTGQSGIFEKTDMSEKHQRSGKSIIDDHKSSNEAVSDRLSINHATSPRMKSVSATEKMSNTAKIQRITKNHDTSPKKVTSRNEPLDSSQIVDGLKHDSKNDKDVVLSTENIFGCIERNSGHPYSRQGSLHQVKEEKNDVDGCKISREASEKACKNESRQNNKNEDNLSSSVHSRSSSRDFTNLKRILNITNILHPSKRRNVAKIIQKDAHNTENTHFSESSVPKSFIPCDGDISSGNACNSVLSDASKILGSDFDRKLVDLTSQKHPAFSSSNKSDVNFQIKKNLHFNTPKTIISDANSSYFDSKNERDANFNFNESNTDIKGAFMAKSDIFVDRNITKPEFPEPLEKVNVEPVLKISTFKDVKSSKINKGNTYNIYQDTSETIFFDESMAPNVFKKQKDKNKDVFTPNASVLEIVEQHCSMNSTERIRSFNKQISAHSASPTNFARSRQNNLDLQKRRKKCSDVIDKFKSPESLCLSRIPQKDPMTNPSDANLTYSKISAIVNSQNNIKTSQMYLNSSQLANTEDRLGDFIKNLDSKCNSDQLNSEIAKKHNCSGEKFTDLNEYRVSQNEFDPQETQSPFKTKMLKRGCNLPKTKYYSEVSSSEMHALRNAGLDINISVIHPNDVRNKHKSAFENLRPSHFVQEYIESSMHNNTYKSACAMFLPQKSSSHVFSSSYLRDSAFDHMNKIVIHKDFFLHILKMRMAFFEILFSKKIENSKCDNVSEKSCAFLNIHHFKKPKSETRYSQKLNELHNPVRLYNSHLSAHETKKDNTICHNISKAVFLHPIITSFTKKQPCHSRFIELESIPNEKNFKQNFTQNKKYIESQNRCYCQCQQTRYKIKGLKRLVAKKMTELGKSVEILANGCNKLHEKLSFIQKLRIKDNKYDMKRGLKSLRRKERKYQAKILKIKKANVNYLFDLKAISSSENLNISSKVLVLTHNYKNTPTGNEGLRHDNEKYMNALYRSAYIPFILNSDQCAFSALIRILNRENSVKITKSDGHLYSMPRVLVKKSIFQSYDWHRCLNGSKTSDDSVQFNSNDFSCRCEFQKRFNMVEILSYIDCRVRLARLIHKISMKICMIFFLQSGFCRENEHVGNNYKRLCRKTPSKIYMRANLSHQYAVDNLPSILFAVDENGKNYSLSNQSSEFPNDVCKNIVSVISSSHILKHESVLSLRFGAIGIASISKSLLDPGLRVKGYEGDVIHILKSLIRENGESSESHAFRGSHILLSRKERPKPIATLQNCKFAQNQQSMYENMNDLASNYIIFGAIKDIASSNSRFLGTKPFNAMQACICHECSIAKRSKLAQTCFFKSELQQIISTDIHKILSENSCFLRSDRKNLLLHCKKNQIAAVKNITSRIHNKICDAVALTDSIIKEYRDYRKYTWKKQSKCRDIARLEQVIVSLRQENTNIIKDAEDKKRELDALINRLQISNQLILNENLDLKVGLETKQKEIDKLHKKILFLTCENQKAGESHLQQEKNRIFHTSDLLSSQSSQNQTCLNNELQKLSTNNVHNSNVSGMPNCNFSEIRTVESGVHQDNEDAEKSRTSSLEDYAKKSSKILAIFDCKTQASKNSFTKKSPKILQGSDFSAVTSTTVSQKPLSAEKCMLFDKPGLAEKQSTLKEVSMDISTRNRISSLQEQFNFFENNSLIISPKITSDNGKSARNSQKRMFSQSQIENPVRFMFTLQYNCSQQHDLAINQHRLKIKSLEQENAILKTKLKELQDRKSKELNYIHIDEHKRHLERIESELSLHMTKLTTRYETLKIKYTNSKKQSTKSIAQFTRKKQMQLKKYHATSKLVKMIESKIQLLRSLFVHFKDLIPSKLQQTTIAQAKKRIYRRRK